MVLAGAPPAVALALTKVLVAFRPAQGDLDTQLAFSVYCELIEGIPEVVVLYVLKRLQTHNPRNPLAQPARCL